jgi:hypothetical protein
VNADPFQDIERFAVRAAIYQLARRKRTRVCFCLGVGWAVTMALELGSLRDALIYAHAGEDKARKAAEEVAGYERAGSPPSRAS